MSATSDAWNPDQYHRFRAQRSQPFYDLIGLLERDCVALGGPRVVDLGCGTGELTAEAHRILGARATIGIDSSPAMLDGAAAQAGDRLTFVDGDLAAFPAPDGGSFDIVLSNAALQWVPDHERVLARWTSALAESGQLAVQVPGQRRPRRAHARRRGGERVAVRRRVRGHACRCTAARHGAQRARARALRGGARRAGLRPSERATAGVRPPPRVERARWSSGSRGRASPGSSACSRRSSSIAFLDAIPHSGCSRVLGDRRALLLRVQAHPGVGPSVIDGVSST